MGGKFGEVNATRVWLAECPSTEFRFYAEGTGKPFNSMELGSDMLFKQIILLEVLLEAGRCRVP